MKKNKLDHLVWVMIFLSMAALYLLLSSCDNYDSEIYDDSCDCETMPPIYIQDDICEDVCGAWQSLTVSGVYPPYQCQEPEPNLVSIKIDGLWYNLDAKAVSGGFVSEEFFMRHGEYEIQEVHTYRSEFHKGALTSAFSLEKLGGIVGMGVPFTQKVNKKTPWIVIQTHCK